MSTQHSTHHESTHHIETLLKALEAALESPIVPGEFENWLESVERAFLESQSELHSHLGGNHQRQLEDVQRQDMDLASRVQHLREIDRQLLDRLHHLDRYILALREREDGDGETQRVDRSAERLIDEALRFVIDVRKQEAAVNTWFVEAFQRDRGVAD